MTSPRQIHLGQRVDPATLDILSDFICGDDADSDTPQHPTYRSSTYLTRFFQSVGIDAQHDGSTRKWWVLGVLEQLGVAELERVILRLVDPREYKADPNKVRLAVRTMNRALSLEGFAVALDEKNRPIITDGSNVTFDLRDDPETTGTTEEEAFLQRQFSDTIDIAGLRLDAAVAPFIQQRIDEIQACPRTKVPLGTIFLLGSTLEGILMSVAANDASRFMAAASAPTSRQGTPVGIADWKLAQLIDVAHDVGALQLDVKKFSHVLRDFRNYIHPYAQMRHGFSPDQHTVDICWQVFRAAIAQLKADAKVP